MPKPIRVVLCIDDNTLLLTSVKEFLENAGYRVLTACNGWDGLQVLEQARVDAVVLDYQMPEMNGETLAQKIKHRSPGLPVIIFTGSPGMVSGRAKELADRVVVKGTASSLILELRQLLPDLWSQ